MRIDVDDAEDGVQDEIRPAQEVARRSLALFAVVGTTLGVPRDEVISWLRTEGLWGALTPHEVAYLEQTNPPRKAHINFGWQCPSNLSQDGPREPGSGR